ncbi:MAG: hypothetical protein WD023_03235 [Ilumatobacteraceae bacterium]
MTVRGAFGIIVAISLVLAGCGGDDEAAATTLAPIITSQTTAPTTAAPTTTAPPASSSTTTSTTTTPESTTTSTSIPAAAALVLRDNGLGDALFGTEADEVVRYVQAVLGPPTADSGWADPFSAFGVCPGTEVRGVTWGDLTLLFSDVSTVATGRRHFFNYVYGPAFGVSIQPEGMRTDTGIGIGSTVADVKAVFPTVMIFPPDIADAYFVVSENLSGFLTGTTDDDTVRSVIGGIGCGE